MRNISFSVILSCIGILGFSFLVQAKSPTILYSKDLGNGFRLEQTEKSRVILYKKREIQRMQNATSRMSISDLLNTSPCPTAYALFDTYVNKLSPIELSGSLRLDGAAASGAYVLSEDGYIKYWKKFISENPYICLPDWNKSFKINSTDNPRFYTLSGTIDTQVLLFDTKTRKLYDKTPFIGPITSVQVGKSGIYLADSTMNQCTSAHGKIYLITPSEKVIQQFELCKIRPDGTYNGAINLIESFELLPNKQIKVTYKENPTWSPTAPWNFYTKVVDVKLK